MIGSGRDFASGWLIDYSGNDEYNFGNRSAGIGDMNGIGIFWDLKGDDSYIHHQNNLSPNSPSLGQSIPMSSQMLIDFRLFKSQNTFNIGMHIDKVGKNIIKENIIR
jgi:hypothetical protein